MNHLFNTVQRPKKKFVIYFFCVIPIIFMIACHQENPIEGDQSNRVLELSTLPRPEISESSYLIFVEQADAHKYHISTLLANIDERRSFEAGIGFSSMQTAYEDFETWSENSIDTGYGVSDGELVDRYKNILIFDQEWDYDYNLSFFGLSTLVNHNAWVQIGDTLFGFPKEKHIKIVNPSPKKMALSREMIQSDPKEGIYIYNNKDASIRLAKTQCTTWGLLGWGTSLILTNHSWAYQDRDKPSGSHEWKQEFQYGQSYGPDVNRFDGYSYISSVKLKYRKRGFLGRWYATRPEAFSVLGSASLTTMNSSTYFAQFEHEKNSPSTWDKTWTENFISNKSNVGAQAILPFIDHQFIGNNFNSGCWDFDFWVEYKHGDGVTVRHSQSI